MSAAKWAIGALLPFAIWPDTPLQLPQSGHFSIAQHFLGADIRSADEPDIAVHFVKVCFS